MSNQASSYECTHSGPIFVQRLRSKPWTYKSKVFFFFLFFFLSVFLFFFHSVSNFLGASSPRRRGRAQLATPSANSAKLIGEALGEGVELEG